MVRAAEKAVVFQVRLEMTASMPAYRMAAPAVVAAEVEVRNGAADPAAPPEKPATNMLYRESRERRGYSQSVDRAEAPATRAVWLGARAVVVAAAIMAVAARAAVPTSVTTKAAGEVYTVLDRVVAVEAVRRSLKRARKMSSSNPAKATAETR